MKASVTCFTDNTVQGSCHHESRSRLLWCGPWKSCTTSWVQSCPSVSPFVQQLTSSSHLLCHLGCTWHALFYPADHYKSLPTLWRYRGRGGRRRWWRRWRWCRWRCWWRRWGRCGWWRWRWIPGNKDKSFMQQQWEYVALKTK